MLYICHDSRLQASPHLYSQPQVIYITSYSFPKRSEGCLQMSGHSSFVILVADPDSFD